MVDANEAKDILYNMCSKIAGGLKLAVKKDYILPMEIKMNPFTFEPYVADIQKNASYLTDICIGRKISDEDVMPGICIQVQENIDARKINDFFEQFCNQNKNFKHIHPQLRRGILLFGPDPIPKEMMYANYNIKAPTTDFIEVLGHAWDQEEKISSILEDLIQDQITASENIARVIYGKDEFRSYRGSIIS